MYIHTYLNGAHDIERYLVCLACVLGLVTKNNGLREEKERTQHKRYEYVQALSAQLHIIYQCKCPAPIRNAKQSFVKQRRFPLPQQALALWIYK